MSSGTSSAGTTAAGTGYVGYDDKTSVLSESPWFDENYQHEKLSLYLPKGKAYNQEKVENTAFWNIIEWLSLSFKWLVELYNQTFKGLYLCASDYLLDRHMKDYGIPNDVFYRSYEENRTDVYVLKYLMKGNTIWNFKAIANIYGIDVIVKSGVDYFDGSRLPNSVPTRLYSNTNYPENILAVSFLNIGKDILPHSVPHKLGDSAVIAKIKKIYDIIRERQCRILYLEPSSTIYTEYYEDRLPASVPHYLGIREKQTVVYDDIGEVERLTFCDGVQLEYKEN